MSSSLSKPAPRRVTIEKPGFEIDAQTIADFDGEFVQQIVALLHWGGNVRLSEALKVSEHGAWYARQAIDRTFDYAVDAIHALAATCLCDTARPPPAARRILPIDAA